MIARALDRSATIATALLGTALLVLAVRGAVTPAPPIALDASGTWADDGWSRGARGALLFATGLAVLGLVRVAGPRRLLAAAVLSLAALAFAVSAAALDLTGLWAGIAFATALSPLAVVAADPRRTAARHALAVALLGGLATGVLAVAFLTLTALAGSTHSLEIGFLVARLEDASPLALTAVRATAVAVAMLAAWAPFHLGLPELWGEGSAPLAGWLAVVWPWAGWSVIVRLSNGLFPALEDWGLDGATAVSLFLVLGAIVPASAALAEQRAGRMLALLGAGTLSELLLAVHTQGIAAASVAGGLWGYALAWVCGSAALAGARGRAGSDAIADLSGLARRVPRTSLALAAAVLLWAGLPGTFSLAVRWQLWQEAIAPDAGASPFALFTVAVGGLLRVLVAARLLQVLYFRAPAADAAIRPVLPGARVRWAIVFVVALALEFALGLGPEVWRAPLVAPGPVLRGG
ncbi:MAG: proton-conducting transporter membrane subunit [Candidatus Eiseniibacteriota bacterium]